MDECFYLYLNKAVTGEKSECREWLESLGEWKFRIASCWGKCGRNWPKITNWFCPLVRNRLKLDCVHMQKFQASNSRKLQPRVWRAGRLNRLEELHKDWRSGRRPSPLYVFLGSFFLVWPFLHGLLSLVILLPLSILQMSVSSRAPTPALYSSGSECSLLLSPHSVMFQLPCVLCWVQNICPQLRPSLSISPLFSCPLDTATWLPHICPYSKAQHCSFSIQLIILYSVLENGKSQVNSAHTTIVVS